MHRADPVQAIVCGAAGLAEAAVTRLAGAGSDRVGSVGSVDFDVYDRVFRGA
jgi:hypothetical protein